MDRSEWVMLVHRLPREPTKPPITLWRKLRRLGVTAVVDDVVGLPLDSRNREQLEWLADEVVEAGGEATIWIASLSTAAHKRSLATAMSERIAAEYRTITRDAERALGSAMVERRRTLPRRRRELRRVASRDYFPTPEGDQARRAVEGLATQVVALVG